MNKRGSRVFRVILVSMLVVALSAVYTSSAQSSLTQDVRTKDGQISVHLPQGWLEQDTSASIYPSVLTFGDSVTSLQAAVESVQVTQTTFVSGLNGVIAIVSPDFISTADPDSAISTLFNAIVTSTQADGGQVLQQESITLGNGAYDAIVGVAVTPNIQAKGLFGAFTDGSTVAVFSIGAAPEATFDANSQMFLDIMNSIRIPAEAGSTTAQAQPLFTPVPANNNNSGQQSGAPSGQQTISVGKSGTFSVRLPQGWASESTTVSNFTDALVFGTDQQAMQVSIDTVVNGGSLTQFQGITGFVGAIDPAQFAGASLDTTVSTFMGRLVGLATSAGAQAINQPLTHTFGGQYPGELQTLNVGFIGVLHTDTQVLFAIVLSDNMQNDSTTMMNILDSIRIPAESPQPSGQQPPPTEAVATEAVAAPTTFRSSDQRVSLVLPGNWDVRDHIADQNTLAYGDSATAALSRLHSAVPSLGADTAISGNGGLVILYTMAQFGIDPNNPDLSALMQRYLGGLQNTTVEQQPQPLAGTNGGLVAVISGSERGYVALIPFGDQIAYVTATGTQDSFDSMQSALMDILTSVHVPAAAEPTPTLPPSSLGGLGGLQAATPEATPQATAAPPSNLGGLGGLGAPEQTVTPPNATPES